MGYTLVRNLDSSSYLSRKLFFLDSGEVDLPPIYNGSDVAPGSLAISHSTSQKWLLNSEYEWQAVPYSEGGGSSGISDAPLDGKLYGRQSGAWSEVTGGSGEPGPQGEKGEKAIQVKTARMALMEPMVQMEPQPL